MSETNLSRLRKKSRFTQAQLADMTQTHKQQIVNVEIWQRDIGGVSLRIASKWAVALGVHAEELLDSDLIASPNVPLCECGGILHFSVYQPQQLQKYKIDDNGITADTEAVNLPDTQPVIIQTCSKCNCCNYLIFGGNQK